MANLLNHREKNHLPSENSGNFLGEKGNSIFIPNDNNILDILHSYGVNGIEYKNEEPDFSPFATQLTMWGEINTTVEIAHMTENRENGKWEFGRRPNGKKFDKNYEIGNFAQADYEMCEKIKAKNANLKLDPKDIEKFRKENKLTWHECKDGKTMMLIPEEIHKRFPHSGGVSEMSYRMEWGDIDLFN